MRDGICISEDEYYPVKSKEGMFYVFSPCYLAVLKNDRVFVEGRVGENKYFNSDIFLSGRIKNIVSGDVEVKERSSPGLVRRIKIKVKNNFKKLFSPHNFDLTSMLLFGKSISYNKEIKDVFRKIGMSHIVVTSGQHLSILIDIFTFVFSFVPLLFVSFFNIFFVLFFLVIVGFSVSLVRAFLMFIYNLTGRLLGRIPDKFNNLLICCVLMFLVNPSIMFFDVGFKLSILSVFGLLFIYPLLGERFCVSRQPLIGRYLAGLFLISLSVLVSTYPYLIYAFKEISLIAPLSNFLLVPFVLPIMVSVLFLVCLSFLFLGLAKLVSFFVEYFITLFFSIALFLSKLKMITFVFKEISFEFIMIYYICLVIFVLYIYYRNKRLKMLC